MLEIEEKTLEELESVMKDKKMAKNVIVGLITSLVVFMAICLVIIGIGIYRFNWQSPVLTRITDIIPFPAAKVNTFWVRYSDYFSNYEALKIFNTKQYAEGSAAVPADPELKQIVIDRLVRNCLLSFIAISHQVNISQTEIDSEYKKIVDAQGSEQTVADFLKEWYGWTPQQYQKYFLEPYLISQALSEKITDAEPENIAAKEKIAKIQNILRNKSESFENLAREYGEDSFAASGGAMGFVPRGFYPQEVEDQLWAINAGDYTDIISLSDSYQIIQVISKDENEGLLEIARIYVKLKNLDDVLAQAKGETEIEVYVR